MTQTHWARSFLCRVSSLSLSLSRTHTFNSLPLICALSLTLSYSTVYILTRFHFIFNWCRRALSVICSCSFWNARLCCSSSRVSPLVSNTHLLYKLPMLCASDCVRMRAHAIAILFNYFTLVFTILFIINAMPSMFSWQNDCVGCYYPCIFSIFLLFGLALKLYIRRRLRGRCHCGNCYWCCCCCAALRSTPTHFDSSNGLNLYKSQFLAFIYCRTNGTSGSAIQFSIWLCKCMMYPFIFCGVILMLSLFTLWMSHFYVYARPQW